MDLSRLHIEGFIEINQKHNFYTIALLDKGESRIHNNTGIKQDFSFNNQNKGVKNCFFLSHSSNDKELVNRLELDLSYQNLPVFFDKWEIKVGDSIVDKINIALEQMQGLILVLSTNSIKSDWVKKELSSV